ncbi:hypothetical protein Tco_1226966 [Tanacetum coccineum]
MTLTPSDQEEHDTIALEHDSLYDDAVQVPTVCSTEVVDWRKMGQLQLKEVDLGYIKGSENEFVGCGDREQLMFAKKLLTLH